MRPLTNKLIALNYFPFKTEQVPFEIFSLMQLFNSSENNCIYELKELLYKMDRK